LMDRALRQAVLGRRTLLLGSWGTKGRLWSGSSCCCFPVDFTVNTLFETRSGVTSGST